jgi:hypothetical protein
VGNRGDDTTRLTPGLEQTLRRYVLGDLEEGLRLELEELLVTDTDAFEALGVIEDELIEEYLERADTAAERQAFEQHFLTCPQHLRRLRFSRALSARASTAGLRVPVEVVPVGRARVPIASWRPAWVGLAAMLAVSLAGNLWLGSRYLTRARPGPPSLTQAGNSGASVATFALAPGLLRAGGSLRRLSVPADAIVVRLRLDLPADEYSLYQAALLDAEGTETWTVSRLRAEQEVAGETAVVLVLPVSLLPPGDYQVKLSGVASDGALESIASYPFRVTAE